MKRFSRFLIEIGIAMQKDLPDIEKFKDFVFTLEKDLPTIYKKLQTAQRDINTASKITQHAKEAIPKQKH